MSGADQSQACVEQRSRLFVCKSKSSRVRGWVVVNEEHRITETAIEREENNEEGRLT
jgi:hypothetical protein